MATIEMRNDGSGTLSFGNNRFECKGRPGFDYTRDLTLKPQDCYAKKWSGEYGVNMEWAVGPIQWRRGAYVHAGNPNGNSAGCILLRDGEAKRFHDFVKGRNSTRVKVEYPW